MSEVDREADHEAEELDCGDNSCHFAKNKTGMRTNGGCRCFYRAGLRSRSLVACAVEILPKYLALESSLAASQSALEECFKVGEYYLEELKASQERVKTLEEHIRGLIAVCQCEQSCSCQFEKEQDARAALAPQEEK